jgi:hypothetical protein
MGDKKFALTPQGGDTDFYKRVSEWVKEFEEMHGGDAE